MRVNFPSSLLTARPKNTILQDGQFHPMFQIRYNKSVCVCVCVCVRKKLHVGTFQYLSN